MFDAQVIAQGLFELLMERSVIGQPAAFPYLLQIRNELLQWRQVRFGYCYGFVVDDGFLSFPKCTR
jgi:hypothetical protein